MNITLYHASYNMTLAAWKHELQDTNPMQIGDNGKRILEKYPGFAEGFQKSRLKTSEKLRDNLLSDKG